MKENKYNHKFFIGLLFGVVISNIVVVYASVYASEYVFYNNANSTLTSTDVQGSIDELANKYAVPATTCPNKYVCFLKKTTLAVGDYIKYIPSSTSYTTDTTYTGYSSTQTINPKQLKLWRVLRINGNGTVDIISEYLSSTKIYFSGQTGFKNLVGYLNVLASQYENPAYTSGSRHFGYNGQTNHITDSTYFTNPAPWTCSTSGTCSPDPDDYEAYGGGDALYTTDSNLVYTALGTRRAYVENSTTLDEYWMASRRYVYTSGTDYNWAGRYIDGTTISSSNLYRYYGSSYTSNSYSYSLRPIVTLKSGLSYSGLGIKDYPMEIVG